MSAVSDPRLEEALEGYILGTHPLMKRVRAAIARCADSNLPVLVTGETGTGKGLAIRGLHEGSRRKVLPMEYVTSGELGDTAWSVLFGHRKGAFTGALADHEGVFETARGSSVVLEDVADLPRDIQPVLLRALERGVFRPLGASRETSADVRVLASTNRPLDLEVHHRRFRADLYERLAVLKILLPPLRAHPEDIRLYIPHFFELAVRKGASPKEFSDAAMNLSYEYEWPRNVRELEHVVYRAAWEIPGDMVGADALARLLEPESVAMAGLARGCCTGVDETLLRRTLNEHGGNKSATARRLSISRGTLYKLMKQFDLDPSESIV